MTTTITLVFEDPDAAAAALDYIGDPDAPVSLDDGHVTIGGTTYPLWEAYTAAAARLGAQLDEV